MVRGSLGPRSGATTPLPERSSIVVPPRLYKGTAQSPKKKKNVLYLEVFTLKINSAQVLSVHIKIVVFISQGLFRRVLVSLIRRPSINLPSKPIRRETHNFPFFLETRPPSLQKITFLPFPMPSPCMTCKLRTP